MALLGLSALLVFGTTAVILRNLGMQDGELHFGFEQLIHARVPWLLLALLWGGLVLGIAAVVQRRGVSRLLVVGLEVLPVAAVTAYVFGASFPPPHALAIGVGDPFPAWSLADHEGAAREFSPGPGGEPTLYVFYRGDW